MRNKCRSIATFHRPIHSHWSLRIIMNNITRPLTVYAALQYALLYKKHENGHILIFSYRFIGLGPCFSIWLLTDTNKFFFLGAGRRGIYFRKAIFMLNSNTFGSTCNGSYTYEYIQYKNLTNAFRCVRVVRG
jgi:hypothetical protein